MFGWHSVEEFDRCTSHIRMTWTDSRNNPHFSRFDAVNSKYEHEEEVRIRGLLPPVIRQKSIYSWFYTYSEPMDLS